MAGPSQLQIIRGFLQDRRILIVDSASSARIAIQRVLVELGAKTSNIVAVPTFNMAISEIAGLTTRSEGEGEDRHILIIPAPEA